MMNEEVMDAVGGTEVPFDVNEPSSIGDLTDVKDSRAVLPATSNVKVRISKAEIKATKDGSVEKIGILWEVVDGVPIGDEMKFKGFKFFQSGEYTKDSIFSKIDYDVKTSDWWGDRKRFVNLKNLLLACSLPVNDVVVNDELLRSLEGKVLKGNVIQYAKQEKTDEVDSNGKPVYKNTGELDNAVRYFKVIPVEELV